MDTSSVKVKKDFRKPLLICLLFIIIFLAAIIVFMINNLLSYDRIYNGVYIKGTNVGGLTGSEAITLLKNTHDSDISKMSFPIKFNGKSDVIPYSSLNTQYEYEKAVMDAMQVGRNGNFIERLSDIYYSRNNSINISLPITYSKSLLQASVEKFNKASSTLARNPDISRESDNFIIELGTSGKTFDIEKALGKCADIVEKQSTDPVELEATVSDPEKLDIAKLYNKVATQPQEVQYVVTNKVNLELKAPVNGIGFDTALAESLISKVDKNSIDPKITVPVIITKPKLSIDDVNVNLFKDVLSKNSSVFNKSLVERTINLTLAAKAINGKVMLPGETFSFNDTVGMRTTEGGYLQALTYEGGKIIENIGGGICQVSSTLFYATFIADLQVTDRRNHQMPISYVPLGKDATVSYGTQDFKFKNTTDWPIKINIDVQGNVLTVTILGTKTNPDVVITGRTETVKQIPFKETIINDPTMYEGERKITQYGMTGAQVNLYRIVTDKGVKVSEKLAYSSYYNPLSQEVHVGTKKKVQATSPSTGN